MQKNRQKMREVEPGLYGGYLPVSKDQIQEAKEVLLEDMILSIRELAKQDDFWIVKTAEDYLCDDLYMALHKEGFPADKVTVAWKIHFPQMDEKT